jgi:hypothetical protein
LRSLLQLFGEQSRLTQAGLTIMGVGAALALAYHLGLVGLLVSSQLAGEMFYNGGHFLVFLGMIVALVGILYEGHRQSHVHPR